MSNDALIFFILTLEASRSINVMLYLIVYWFAKLDYIKFEF